MPIDYKEIEAKWQKAWSDAHAYEPEPDGRKSLMVNAAFPYVNTPLHIGHMRTYGTADIYARYKRMRGFNVLYPMGFHATGIPIIAVAKRIKNRDADLIEDLKSFNIPEEDIMKMEDPNFCAEYIKNITEKSFHSIGFGIDWRRKFISIEPIFSKMVEWQFKKLNDKGVLERGLHPVGWCINENNAVGQHDTKGDVDPQIEEVIAIKFKDAKSDAYFLCATYRPETIDGVTNLFIGKDIDYVIAESNGVNYIIAYEAANFLGYQIEINIKEHIKGDELLARKAINPYNNEVIPILPGYFVKSNKGSGVVMSVPSHAPFDYVALEELRRSGYDLGDIKYKRVIEIKKPNANNAQSTENEDEVKTDGDMPALAYLDALAGDQRSADAIEHATKMLYRAEARWGFMIDGKYKGLEEAKARELIKKDLLSSSMAINTYELTNTTKAICRCGTPVVIKNVDQWFINYGKEEWKKNVREYINGVALFPPESINVFNKVIDWIDMKATERAQGLGTPFPLNKDHIVESLSDSTIYMTLYTYIHLLREANAAPEQLSYAFFDYVLLGVGTPEEVAESTKLPLACVKRCRESFTYWYSSTSRHSGPDLIYNHLTMYMFMHVLLFDKEFWPKQIVTNGFVNYEGQKMSKSLGNTVPIDKSIAKYGADVVRFVENVTAELKTNTDFTENGMSSIIARNETIYNYIYGLMSMKSQELTRLDYWMYSKINSKIKKATEDMDKLDFKAAYMEIYYNSISELKRYVEHGGSNEIVLREFIEKTILMLSPAMPHVAEEFWHTLGKSSLAVQEKWPEFDESMINVNDEYIEKMIDDIELDLRNALERTSKIDNSKDKKIKSIEIIIANQWKSKAYNMLVEKRNISQVVASDELADVPKEILSKFLSNFAKNIQSISKAADIDQDLIFQSFNDASAYLSKRFGAQVIVSKEQESKSPRALRAQPDKPGIDVVWE